MIFSNVKYLLTFCKLIILCDLVYFCLFTQWMLCLRLGIVLLWTSGSLELSCRGRVHEVKEVFNLAQGFYLSVRSSRRGLLEGNSFPQVHQGKWGSCQTYWSALLSHLFSRYTCWWIYQHTQKCLLLSEGHLKPHEFDILTFSDSLHESLYLKGDNLLLLINLWIIKAVTASVCVTDWWMIPAGKLSRQEDSLSRWVNILQVMLLIQSVTKYRTP